MTADNSEKVLIASDHGGLLLKQQICEFLTENSYEFIDLGPDTEESVDYPDYAKKLIIDLKVGKGSKGILICGTGIGMSIAANRYNGIRAALCTTEFMAKMSRAHNDSNVLVLGGRVIGIEVAKEMVKYWLETPFEGDRHNRRLNKIEEM